MSIVIAILGWILLAVIAWHVSMLMLFGIMDTYYNVASQENIKAWLKPKYIWWIIRNPFIAAWGRFIGDWHYTFESSSCNGWTFRPPFKVTRRKRSRKQ